MNHLTHSLQSNVLILRPDAIYIPRYCIFVLCIFDLLNTIDFTKGDILNVIRKLNPNKAHVHAEIRIGMLQISSKAISKPLYLIFSSSIKSGIFPTEWKIANVLPIWYLMCYLMWKIANVVYKRNDKQNVKNY